MTLAAEKELEHIGETKGCADHDHDLIHELSKKLDALWRYDQYVANAQDRPEVQSFWQNQKRQCESDIRWLKRLIAEEIQNGCF
jgi:hypothetical protein